jgi:hypothetical protein
VKVLVDLHNHSCLSPCASLEQSPSLLVRLAAERGVSVLALTDHNSALNCPAFGEACGRAGIAPLFGLEACSSEEVHVLCLFGTAEEALDFGSFLRGLIPALPYDAERLGDEAVVDADEGVLDLLDYWLGSGVDLSYDAICAEAASRGAAVIPAHVDRPMFSVSSQLGFLPAGPYAAVEAMREPPRALTRGRPVISGSDAHYPEHIARRPTLVDLDEGALEAGRSGRGGELLSALVEAFKAGKALPYWLQGGRQGLSK